jgi:hypothetical protein
MGINSCGTTLIDEGLFKNIGAITWDTTAKTTGFTAVSGNGYFVNTTSGAITVTLPSSPSAGDVVGIADYANTADTNNITIGRNGSPIQGDSADFTINTEGRSVLLVYVDGTQGWVITDASKAADITEQATFITATGGTETTCGDFKIHTFTSPGTFCVSSIGNPVGGPNNVDYLVQAGGGGGGGNQGSPSTASGGGGAGGFRASAGTETGCYSVSPSQSGVSALPITVQGYPISVGGGGSGGGPGSESRGGTGGNSIFSTITSAGGGGGGTSGSSVPNRTGANGGSGGGGNAPPHTGSGGSGNTPSVSPPQGNNGGAGGGTAAAGGGGGLAGSGTNGGTGCVVKGGYGGAGADSNIDGTTIYVGQGGGGGAGPCGCVGLGGGSNTNRTAGNGGRVGSFGGSNGTANRGGGGGGSGGPGTSGGNAGSGIVIIRYKYQ